ncbi:MAG: hypothetical protein RH862_19105 [Leptospiraceae bacterium]
MSLSHPNNDTENPERILKQEFCRDPDKSKPGFESRGNRNISTIRANEI